MAFINYSIQFKKDIFFFFFKGFYGTILKYLYKYKQKNQYIKKLIYIGVFLALIEVSNAFFNIGSVDLEF